MSLGPALRERLRIEIEAVVTILGGAFPESVSRPSSGGTWSAHENLAHLYPAMLRGRLNRGSASTSR